MRQLHQERKSSQGLMRTAAPRFYLLVETRDNPAETAGFCCARMTSAGGKGERAGYSPSRVKLSEAELMQ